MLDRVPAMVTAAKLRAKIEVTRAVVTIALPDPTRPNPARQAPATAKCGFPDRCPPAPGPVDLRRRLNPHR
jgi:hypothetical protein